MSACQYLANKALKEKNLNFKASELYGPREARCPIWTTNLIAADNPQEVELLRKGETVATFSLNAFATLSATKFVVEDAVEVAEGLAQYGGNIEEVKERFASEDGAPEG
jgi:hypothetical protein